MISGLGSVSVAIVTLWLVASALYQIGAFRRRLARFDLLELLPSWSFFAPHPATRDSHVVIQDLRRDGTLSGWETVTSIPPRRLLDVVWNPTKRPRKILRDAAKSAQRTRRNAGSDGVVQCSMAYLVILHFCLEGVPHDRSAVARQFAIVETSGRHDRRLWITFISIFHQFSE